MSEEGQSPRTLLIELCIGGLLIFTLSVTTARLAGTGGGNAAEWVSATATVAAFIAAGMAAWFTARTLRIEEQREGRMIEQLARAQASQLAVWAEVGMTTGEGPTSHGQFLHSIDEVNILARNASNLPVTNVVLAFILDIEIGEQGRSRFDVGHRELPLIAPSSDAVPLPIPEASVDLLKAFDGYIRAAMANDRWWNLNVDLTFRDASGVLWHRSGDSGLLDVIEPRHA